MTDTREIVSSGSKLISIVIIIIKFNLENVDSIRVLKEL